MIFNPLFNLVQKDQDKVKSFLCNYFYENNYQISKDDINLISEKLDESSKLNLNDVDVFLEKFQNNKSLYKVLSHLKSENKYGFFTNGKRVYISTLDGPALALTICYLNTFGYENIEN